jgi:hypothetical protein
MLDARADIVEDRKIPEVARDVHGWRVFSEEEAHNSREHKNMIIPPGQ